MLLRSNPGWDETYIHRSIPDFQAVKAKWTGNGRLDERGPVSPNSEFPVIAVKEQEIGILMPGLGVSI